MPSNEIDAIFASKVKPSNPNSASSPSNVAPQPSLDGSEAGTGSASKRKRKKKLKKLTSGTDHNESRHHSLQGAVEPESGKRTPEIIIDPSASVLTTRAKAVQIAGVEQVSDRLRKKRKTSDDEDNKLFRDSRGTKSRRKTEDGYSIYKEDELGISDRGGDTPLCPFDCDCCF